MSMIMKLRGNKEGLPIFQPLDTPQYFKRIMHSSFDNGFFFYQCKMFSFCQKA
jgi:hypothetical protein